MASNNKDIKIITLENKIIGIDKFVIDLSFLEGYINKSKEILKKNIDQAEFIQTRILLDKFWTKKNKCLNNSIKSVLDDVEEDYFLENIFLYDHFNFYKMIIKDYSIDCDCVYSTIIHPVLFILNLAILLYFQDKREIKYSNNIYSKYNYDYNDNSVNFLSKNTILFEEKYNKLLNLKKNAIKISIKNFQDFISIDVFKKFVYKKYSIKWDVLETIINYSKNSCSDGNKVIPTLEFSPLYSYLSVYCVLEGIIEELIESTKCKIDVVSFDTDVYLFFDDFAEWPKIKFDIENNLFTNKLRSNCNRIEIIKNDGVLVNNKNEKIKFNCFYLRLLEHFKNKKNFTSSREVFLDFLNRNNLENPFSSLDTIDIDIGEYKDILKIINSNDKKYYFEIIDSNPKYFIKLFYLLDKKYSYSDNDFLLKNVILKFQEYKYNSNIINENYYIYYYLYNSFNGLYNNAIDDNKFIDINEPNYINFQLFIFTIYEIEKYSSLDNVLSANIKHNKLTSSLMFFLRNQYLLSNYNDCVLIVSTLYDLLKKEIKKFFTVKNHEDFINKLNKTILPRYNIEEIILSDWNYINKIRNLLSSCHMGRTSDENINNFTLIKISNKLRNIMIWLFNYSSILINNNFNKFLFCIEAESNKK